MSINKKKISIIIPTFNERENIIPLVSEIRKICKANKYNFEVIVIDDNSSDQTAAELLKKYGKTRELRVFVRKKERGLATAILFGLKKAKGNIILGMDADFNHPPARIPELIKALRKADLAVASRFIKDGGMEDRFRYVFTFLFNLFLRRILGFPTMDNLSGFYCIKKEKLFSLPLEKIFRGFGEYHLRLVFLANANNFKIKEIPAFYPLRHYGQSKANLKTLFFVYLKEAFLLKLWKS